MGTLPIELLTQVLLVCGQSHPQRERRKWLSRVSQLWKSVVDGCPLFWTEVALTRSMKEMQEILRRNANGPLDVSLSPGNSTKPLNEDIEKRIEMILLESHRWRSLMLVGHLRSKPYIRLLTAQALRLSNLQLVRTVGIVADVSLAKEGVALHEVTLCGAAIDWGSPRLTSGLRCLRLHDLLDKKPDTAQFHALLLGSPELEILELVDAISSHPAERPAELQAVLLPSLITLIIEQRQPAIAFWDLLSLIQAPACKYISIPSVFLKEATENTPFETLAPLLQGPLSIVPRLLVSYNQGTGVLVLTHHEIHTSPQSDARESTFKLAKRRGVYLTTAHFLLRDTNDAVVRKNQRNICKFIAKAIVPALKDIRAPVQLDLQDVWPPAVASRDPRRTVTTDLLLNLSCVTHLHLRFPFEPQEVLRLLSSPQQARGVDGPFDDRWIWPTPRLETLSVSCYGSDELEISRAAESLFLKRRPLNARGADPLEPGLRTDGSPGQSLPVTDTWSRIDIRNEAETSVKMWERGSGWRFTTGGG